VDELLRRGITPYATLYHWDLPQALQDRGGWPHRDTAAAFLDYVDIVTRTLGDRVKHWFTHNEPWCVAMLGHAQGIHAPGLCDGPAALAAAHHLLLSHGQAVPLIRANAPDSSVGIVLNLTPAYPASDREADRRAARIYDGQFNRWFLDPLHGRGYPADIAEAYRRQGWLPEGPLPFVQPRRPHDHRHSLRCARHQLLYPGHRPRRRRRIRRPPARRRAAAPAEELTDMGWEVYPEGLHDLLVRVHRDYAPARLLIAENGCSHADGPGPDGRIRDERRIRYLRDHFAQARRAMDQGVPLQGYFVWSLMDNFEWQCGYRQRFGLVWVDFETQQRTPKDSAAWVTRQIAADHAPDPMKIVDVPTLQMRPTCIM
jgi:beta-glucosidase